MYFELAYFDITPREFPVPLFEWKNSIRIMYKAQTAPSLQYDVLWTLLYIPAFYYTATKCTQKSHLLTSRFVLKHTPNAMLL